MSQSQKGRTPGGSNNNDTEPEFQPYVKDRSSVIKKATETAKSVGQQIAQEKEMKKKVKSCGCW